MVSVTEGGALKGEGRGSARLVALEGDNQDRRLWRILASRGIIEARNAQTRPFSLFSAFFCDYRPPRCRQRWIPIQTPMVVYPLYPAMSTECERVFSSTKKLLIPERNQLAEDIIEACEYLKA